MTTIGRRRQPEMTAHGNGEALAPSARFSTCGFDRSRRRDESHGREVASIAADIACEEREAAHGRVRADIEVRQNTLLRSLSAAVTEKRLAR